MRRLAAVMAALVLVIGAAAVVVWMQLRAERGRGEELAARVAALEAAAPSSGAGIVIAAGISADVAKATEGGVSAMSMPPTASPQGNAADAAMSIMAAEMVRTLYPDLAPELGLSKEEADQFLALLARQQGELGMDSMAMFTGGEPPQAIWQLQVLDKEKAHRDEQEAVLGSRYARWKEYQGVAAARLEVEQLRTVLAATGNPLSDAQARELEAAFAAEETRNRDDERSWLASDAARRSANPMRDQMQREIDSRNRLVDVARPHLSNAQTDAFRKQVEREISTVEAMMSALGGREAQ